MILETKFTIVPLVLKFLAQKATRLQLLGYLYSIPLGKKSMMGKPVIDILKH